MENVSINSEKAEKFKKRLKKMSKSIVFLAILAALCSFVISFMVYKMPSTAIDSIDANYVLNGAFVYAPFKNTIQGGSSESIIIKPYSSFKNLENPAIYFDTDLYWDVIFNGKSIGSFSPDDARFGSTIGDRMNIVPLPTKYSGEELVIVFYAPDNITSDKIPSNIYLSSYGDIVKGLVKNYIPILSTMIVVIVLSLMFIAIDEIALRKATGTHLLTMLGLSAIGIAVWVITQNSITGLIFGYNYGLIAVQYITFIAMQGFVLVFFIQYPLWKKARKNIVIPILFVAAGFLYLLLDMSGALSFTVTYTFSMLSLILILIEIIATSLRFATSNAELPGQAAVMFFGNMLMAVLSIVDLYRNLNGDSDHSACSRLGITIYVVSVGLYQIYSILLYLKDSEEKKAVQKLAFYDALTGIENRMAFNERVDQLEKSRREHPDVTYNPGMIIFDLNNLKKANDIYGHTEGDALIKTAGQTLDAVFSDIGTAYRYGGDEFVVVIESFYEDFVKQHLKKLSDREAIINNKNTFNVPFAIAYGYAAYESDKDKDLMQTLDRADEIMYVNKQAMKAKARAAAGETGPAPIDDRLT